MTPAAARTSAITAPATTTGAGSFVGRRAQVAELVGLLDVSRLVTLTGPPGIGKTRLALEAVAESSGDRSAGAAFAELAPAADPAMVPAALAASLSLQEIAGESLVETVVARLGDRRYLIVLDNCEHVLETCVQLVAMLLERCPRLRVLATSREPLGAEGELVWRVPALSIPARSQASLAELLAYDSIRLFVERARAVEPGFALNDHVAPAVVEICHRLDGVPLPIELAAARVGSLTPAEIARRLDDRFGLLTDRNGRERPRRRALETALDWSHRLLAAPERVLLRRLSVFVGGFDLEAAGAVCAGGEVTPAAVPGLIERLCSKSLVILDPAVGRFGLLETIHAYARERLEDAGETRAFRESHARFYTALAEQAEPELTGPGQQRWFERLEPERPNLRAAVEWSVGHARGEWALRLSGSLVLFWQLRCHFSEGRQLLATALAASDLAPVEVTARARWGEGYLALWAGDGPSAIAPLEDSLERFRELGDGRGCARAQVLLGRCWLLRGYPAGGLALVEHGAALAREMGDAWCLDFALAITGSESYARGDLATARVLLEECLSVARAAGDRQGLRVARLGLGLVSLREGDHRSAETLLEECADVADEMGELYAKARASHHLAEAAFMRGGYARARLLLDDALPMLRRFGMAVGPLALRARVARAEGQPEAARRFAEDAVLLARTKEGNLTLALAELGALELAQGEHGPGRRHLEEVLELARTGTDASSASWAMHNLGELARAAGDAPGAAALHRDALSVRRECRDPLGLLASLEALAGVAVDAGAFERAVRLLGAAGKARTASGHPGAPWERERRRADLALARSRVSAQRFRSAVAEGQRLSLEEAIAAALADDRAGVEEVGWASLTRGELEVAGLVAEGLTNPEIARRSFVSLATVKARLTGIFSKLGITRRSELAREFARRERPASANGHLTPK